MFCLSYFCSLFFSFPFPTPHQREAREGEKGEDQAAGADQGRGIRWRGRHGDGEKDLSAANV